MKSFFEDQVEELKSKDLLRIEKIVESDQGPVVKCQGKTVLNFSSNNYLGLANHPRLKKAAIQAIERYGVGSGASRLITGTMSLHQELEKVLAGFKGCEASLIFNSGYHANIGVITALVDPNDVIFSDELNHASLIDGCRLSKASVMIYRHSDMRHLRELLKSHVEQKRKEKKQGVQISSKLLIVTDTVFSMDGDLCLLPALMKLAHDFDAWIFVDEAHATGVFGEKSRGVVEHYGISSKKKNLIQMGTLGKALGSFGAYVCGPKAFCDFLKNKARTYVFTTALPPAVLAATLEAIRLINQDLSLKNQLWRNVEYFKRGLTQVIANSSYELLKTDSPIFPILVGSQSRTMDLSQKLFDEGIWIQGIRPPTVPDGTSRLRLTLMATHTKEHLDKCLVTLEKVLKL